MTSHKFQNSLFCCGPVARQPNENAAEKRNKAKQNSFNGWYMVNRFCTVSHSVIHALRSDNAFWCRISYYGCINNYTSKGYTCARRFVVESCSWNFITMFSKAKNENKITNVRQRYLWNIFHSARSNEVTHSNGRPVDLWNAFELDIRCCFYLTRLNKLCSFHFIPWRQNNENQTEKKEVWSVLMTSVGEKNIY